MKKKTKFFVVSLFPTPPPKTITAILGSATTLQRPWDLLSNQSWCLLHAEGFQSKEREGNFIEAQRQESTGLVWDFTRWSLWLETTFLLKREQEVVVGEDEKGIDFQVERLFSCKGRCRVCWPITKSLGLNLDLLPNHFPFHSYGWMAGSPWTPKKMEFSLEKSLKEYFC